MHLLQECLVVFVEVAGVDWHGALIIQFEESEGLEGEAAEILEKVFVVLGEEAVPSEEEALVLWPVGE